jgi:hypothetical protein
MDLSPLAGAIGYFGEEIGSSSVWLPWVTYLPSLLGTCTLIYRLQRRHRTDPCRAIIRPAQKLYCLVLPAES